MENSITSSCTSEDIDALWDYSEPGESEQRFRALIPTLEHAGETAAVTETLTQIARARGLLGDFEAAHEVLDQVERRIAGDDSPVRVRALLERGRVFNSSGDAERAKPLFQEALHLAVQRKEDFYAIDAAHMLGIMGELEEQRAWSARALQLAQSSAQERARNWLGPLYNNLGWTYHDLGQYEKALDLFTRGVAWRAAHDQPREEVVARWAYGRCLRSLRRLGEALAVQEENLRRLQDAPNMVGEIHHEIGECLLLLDRAGEARPHFAAAHDVFSTDPWHAGHEAEKLNRLRTLADGSDDPLSRLRTLCLALPETVERLSHGEPTWFVRGKKVFVMYADHHHDDRVAFWCAAPPLAQSMLAADQPRRYFIPPYVGHRGWLGVYLDVELDWNEIGAIVTDAYRVVAPKRLAALLE